MSSKPNGSTSDLLSWSETPPPAADSGNVKASGNPPRSHQPSDGISKTLFGGQISEEEAESLNKRKPCSGYKLKEITGNKIFGVESPNSGSSGKRTSVRIVQQATKGMSQISFSSEEEVSLKKPVSVPEAAKQRELSGTFNDSNTKIKKPLSDAKCKELNGNDIFGPAPEITPRNLEVKAMKQFEEPAPPPPRNIRTSVRVSNPAGGQSNIMFSEETEVKATKKTIHNQKFAELTGNDIFKGDVATHGSSEKPLSSAKQREMSGSDIFADGKVESRDYLGGVRKPPGGESSIALI
uniref:uncharacterized protein LOC122587190 n=1 Tax=Erigeron canadensis TaxID=72917 RepID=UPI001CB9BD6D|nr:uncharacterized protein LOC122587190 [Erigeron canadensis]